MMDSLNIAATGMNAQQRTIDVIANNLANLNTPGFKKSRIEFADLMYGEVLAPGASSATRSAACPLGMGTAIARATKDFRLGDIKTSDSPFDFAIRGDGFFEVVLPDGSLGYSRTGAFQVDQDRTLVTADGRPALRADPAAAGRRGGHRRPDGTAKARVAGETEPVEIGRLELARFVNPSGLEAMGGNVYRPTEASGDPLYGNPGEEGVGLVAQGFLEART